jgi:catechol 2,3-dioxygenase-like lactoylglutathione lyase family enzyme
MIDHVYISVTDVDRSLAFYSEALKPVGWSPVGNYDSASGPEGVPDLSGIGDDAFGSRKAVGSSIWLRQRQPGETGDVYARSPHAGRGGWSSHVSLWSCGCDAVDFAQVLADVRHLDATFR